MPGRIAVADCQGPQGTACGKHPHPSKSSAKAHAKRLLASDPRCPLDVYRCSYCGAWHVGHRHPRRVRKRDGAS